MIEIAWLFVVQPVVLCLVILPTILIGIASWVRFVRGIPFSSWADTLLAIVAFDATAILDNEPFRALFRNPHLADRMIQIHFLMMFFAAVGWMALVWFVEKLLSDRGETSFTTGRKLIISWSGVLPVSLLIALHMVTYMAGATK